MFFARIRSELVIPAKAGIFFNSSKDPVDL